MDRALADESTGHAKHPDIIKHPKQLMTSLTIRFHLPIVPMRVLEQERLHDKRRRSEHVTNLCHEPNIRIKIIIPVVEPQLERAPAGPQFVMIHHDSVFEPHPGILRCEIRRAADESLMSRERCLNAVAPRSSSRSLILFIIVMDTF